jgi:hypothetical protein
LALNFAGGSFEYKSLSEVMAVGVNESFHSSTPWNATDGACVNE